MFWNVKIYIWKDFILNFFPSKSYVLYHSEAIDMHYEKLLKKTFFCRCPQKPGFVLRGGGIRERAGGMRTDGTLYILCIGFITTSAEVWRREHRTQVRASTTTKASGKINARNLIYSAGTNRRLYLFWRSSSLKDPRHPLLIKMFNLNLGKSMHTANIFYVS